MDPVYFKSIMSSSEEAVSWKGLLPQTGLPSLSSPGSWSEPVEAHCPSGLASAVEGLSKEPDVTLEEKRRWKGPLRRPLKGPGVWQFRAPKPVFPHPLGEWWVGTCRSHPPPQQSVGAAVRQPYLLERWELQRPVVTGTSEVPVRHSACFRAHVMPSLCLRPSRGSLA